MDLEVLSLEEIKRGYTSDGDGYTCVSCGARFEEGEVYPVEGHFYQAERAARLHLEGAHGDYLESLVGGDSKYNTLTDHQRELLLRFAAGAADKEIAKEMGVSASTVRHQKFTFREKAKQAKLYLAVYEKIFQEERGANNMAPIHDNAKMVDERYVVTQEERRHILDTFFAGSQPLKLKAFSPKEKKKVVILSRIAQEFQRDRDYTEGEVSCILREIFDDYATLRRYLIEYGFIERTKDGRQYRLK